MNVESLWYVIPLVLGVASAAAAIASFSMDAFLEGVRSRLNSEIIAKRLLLLMAVVVLPAIWGYMGYVNLGEPTCEETSDGPYSVCISYADDSFEPTDQEKWSEFSRKFIQAEFFLVSMVVL